MAHLEPNAEAQAPIRRRMFGCEFTYDNINHFQYKGYSFDPLQEPEVFHEKNNDINYWKAQLAFRGASSAGNDMDQIWGGDEWEEDGEDEEAGEWEDDWEEEVEEYELYDEVMEDEEDDEYEQYYEIGEHRDEDEDDNGHAGGNFEGIVNLIGGGGGNLDYTYRSWRL
ncbi:predicted protein [Sclerotinia sclerotiorum 1980 UF-70]|uniref:Uncharacterized protein n=2 Tax=Sclerotinia sclerotiorum (strain ATCC 18683 / 1980 / Ss-1) TaxID=665079 RepID=A0A1D9Q1R4_SCLS1|nr:predicted protein [Sclerotinia sclerotiorum 1980 UF-70]APA08877.1 hypothetical protein sscle_04g036470 [Sclerotinia sclerotiorum 1980 UF-70]EDN99833.1 predicted protein [Sclerotinia sclerotiorum 1980 UF-70]